MSECTGVGPHITPPDIRRGIDNAMSDTSENPVMNKVIKAYVDQMVEDLMDYIDEQIETVQRPVPGEYTHVEYILSTNSKTQYIDTGLTLDNSLRFFIEGRTAANEAAIFADAYQSSSMRQGGVLYNRSNPRFDYWWTGVSYSQLGPESLGGAIDYTKRFELRQDSNGVAIIQGEHMTKVSYNGTALTSPTPVLLFNTARTDISGTHTVIYAATIAHGHDVVREFIPVIRTADGEPGLYDKVNDTFYPSIGGASFIAGPAL